MGKSLIIKGADFSANAIASTIVWYNEYTDLVGKQHAGGAATYSYFLPLSVLSNLNMVNSPVDAVKLYVDESCTIAIRKIVANQDLPESGDTISGNVAAEEIISEQTFDIAAGEHVLQWAVPITITSSDVTTKRTTIEVRTKPRSCFSFNASSGEGWNPILASAGYDSTHKVPIQFGYRKIG